MSTLYKTSGLVVEIDDNPENPNQPKQPGRIIPGGSGQDNLPIVLTPHPVTNPQSAPFPTPPGSGNSPNGPSGNVILLSQFLGSGGGRKIPPGTIIIDDI